MMRVVGENAAAQRCISHNDKQGGAVIYNYNYATWAQDTSRRLHLTDVIIVGYLAGSLTAVVCDRSAIKRYYRPTSHKPDLRHGSWQTSGERSFDIIYKAVCRLAAVMFIWA